MTSTSTSLRTTWFSHSANSTLYMRHSTQFVTLLLDTTYRGIHATTECFQIYLKCLKWFSLCFRGLFCYFELELPFRLTRNYQLPGWIQSKVRGQELSSHTSSTKFLGKFCLNSQIFWKRFNNHNILVTNCEKRKRIVAPVNRKTPNILDERNGYPEFFSLSQAFREISIQEMCRKKTLGFPVYTFPFSDVVLLVARSIAIIQQGPYHPTTSTPLKTSLNKTTWRPLKLFHTYTESPSKKASKVGTKERGQRPSSERDSKIYRLAVPVPSQFKIGSFHVIVVQGRQNMYKKLKRDALAKLLFCS